MIPFSAIALLLMLGLHPQAPLQEASAQDSVPIPKFDCDTVPVPLEAGAYASANPEPLHPFFVYARQHGFVGGIARVSLWFNASGSVASAAISKSSGNPDVDRAVMNWALCTKIKPGKEATAVLPVMFRW